MNKFPILLLIKLIVMNKLNGAEEATEWEKETVERRASVFFDNISLVYFHEHLKWSITVPQLKWESVREMFDWIAFTLLICKDKERMKNILFRLGALIKHFFSFLFAVCIRVCVLDVRFTI